MRKKTMTLTSLMTGTIRAVGLTVEKVLPVLIFAIDTLCIAVTAAEDECAPEQSKCHNYQCCEPHQYCGERSFECETCFPIGSTEDENFERCLEIKNVTDVAANLRNPSCIAACFYQFGDKLDRSFSKESSDISPSLVAVIAVVVALISFICGLGVTVIYFKRLKTKSSQLQGSPSLKGEGCDIESGNEPSNTEPNGVIDIKARNSLNRESKNASESIDHPQIDNNCGHKSDGNVADNCKTRDYSVTKETRLCEETHMKTPFREDEPGNEPSSTEPNGVIDIKAQNSLSQENKNAGESIDHPEIDYNCGHKSDRNIADTCKACDYKVTEETRLLEETHVKSPFREDTHPKPERPDAHGMAIGGQETVGLSEAPKPGMTLTNGENLNPISNPTDDCNSQFFMSSSRRPVPLNLERQPLMAGSYC